MRDRLFDALHAEWVVVGDGHEARATFASWAAVDPALAAFASPAEAVRWCRTAQSADSAGVLRAFVLRADDRLAARTVLQAVLPALQNQVARRMGEGRCSGTASQGWETTDDVGADAVEAAVVRIAELAGTSPTWPAQAICDVVWRRLRASARRSTRRGAPPTQLGEGAEQLEAAPERTEAEELAAAVAIAVRAGSLALDDARVIYATRVLGHTPAEVASAQGRDVRALRAQRRRAERRLEEVGWAPTPAEMDMVRCPA